MVIRDLGQSSLHVVKENLLIVDISEGLIDQLPISYLFAGNQSGRSISLILRIKLGDLSRAQLASLLTTQGLDSRFFVYTDNTNILLAIIPGS